MEQIVFSKKSKKDIALLRKEDVKLMAKLWDLILDICKHPYTGLGKPEALKGDYAGAWSRRISQKHRLIYEVHNEESDNPILVMISCYGHYDDK